MIQRIDNLKISSTEEQEELAWAETLSHRNKLLFNSDWTQASDSYLTERCIIMWRDWRKQVKNVNRRNFSDRALAAAHVEMLSTKMPMVAYTEDAVASLVSGYTSSVSEYRARVIGYLDDKFNKLLVPSFLCNPFLIEEQYQEALDYLSGKGDAFPIITATCKALNIPEDTAAKRFLDEKSAFMHRAATLKTKYHEFHALATKASTDVELEVIKTGIESWTLTST